MSFLTKLFCSGDWEVSVFEDALEKHIENPKGYWIADPFLFKKVRR